MQHINAVDRMFPNVQPVSVQSKTRLDPFLCFVNVTDYRTSNRNNNPWAVKISVIESVPQPVVLKLRQSAQLCQFWPEFFLDYRSRRLSWCLRRRSEMMDRRDGDDTKIGTLAIRVAKLIFA